MKKVEVKNIKKLKNSRYSFDVHVPINIMEDYFEQAYRVLAPSVEIKGFRKGFAPKPMVIQQVGKERFMQTAMDYALPGSYEEAVRSAELVPIAPPQINIQSFGEATDLVYKVEVDVLPQVDAGNYKKLKVKAPKKDVEVKTKEIADVLEKMRKQQAEVAEVERAAKLGDRVEIDFVGSVAGVQKDAYTSKNFPLVLGDNVIEKTIEESLVGKKKADAYKVSAKVEKDKVDFEILVHSVSEVKLPEVDKAFAEQFGRADAKDLEKAIEEQLKTEKETKYNQDLEDLVVKAAIKEAKTEIPASLVEEEINRRIDSIKQQLGVVYEQFLQSQKKTEEDLRKEVSEQAEESVKAGLVLGEITKREGFGKDLPKDLDDQSKQRMAVRKTIDFLVEVATGGVDKKSKAKKDKK